MLPLFHAVINNSVFDSPAQQFLANLVLISTGKIKESDLKLIIVKPINSLAPNYLQLTLIRKSQKSSRALKNNGKDLKLPFQRISNGQKGYYFRGAKSWKGLSADTKRAPSMGSFKLHL